MNLLQVVRNLGHFTFPFVFGFLRHVSFFQYKESLFAKLVLLDLYRRSFGLRFFWVLWASPFEDPILGLGSQHFDVGCVQLHDQTVSPLEKFWVVGVLGCS